MGEDTLDRGYPWPLKIAAAFFVALALEIVLFLLLTRHLPDVLGSLVSRLLVGLPFIVCSVPGVQLLFHKRWRTGMIAVVTGALVGVPALWIASILLWAFAPALVER